MAPLSTAVSLAATGVSTGMSAISQVQQSASTRQQLALQKSRDALQLAEQERNREAELQSTLARQNAWFAASGTDPGSGSALQVANAAASDAEHDMSLIASGAALTEQSRALTATTSNAASARSLLSLGITSPLARSAVMSVWK
ncbi:MAG: hypothetical protein JXQ84_04395 [Rhodospirillaceae bacterium]|nr:hypothetical protein [Rhodospirillaceae bacterium]